MPSLPLPLRVAAGLAATAVDHTRALPGYLIGLPVTLTSQALQLSMRVQQQITELAVRGDEAIASCREPEDEPEWATFDEDLIAEPAGETVDEPETETTGSHTSDEPVLPGYEQLTIAQLRGKVRHLSAEELSALLEHERAHQRRPEFERALNNRLVRVRGH